MELKIKLAYDDIENVKILFTEYTKLLVDTNSDFENYLSLQNYDAEIENIDIKYGSPNGKLYCAYLYENYGFYRIPPYNDSPIEGMVFMKLDL